VKTDLLLQDRILILIPEARFEVFTVMKIKVEVYSVVTLCSVAIGYYHSKRPCCF